MTHAIFHHEASQIFEGLSSCARESLLNAFAQVSDGGSAPSGDLCEPANAVADNVLLITIHLDESSRLLALYSVLQGQPTLFFLIQKPSESAVLSNHDIDVAQNAHYACLTDPDAVRKAY